MIFLNDFSMLTKAINFPKFSEIEDMLKVLEIIARCKDIIVHKLSNPQLLRWVNLHSYV